MAAPRCTNNNHSRMNVPVRFCSDCGEVVGRDISAKNCAPESHAKRRKDRNKFCNDCGKSLATGH